MKTSRYFYGLILLLGISLLACNSSFENDSNENNDLKTNPQEELIVLRTNETVTESILLPEKISKVNENGRVTVSFMLTARPYYLNTQGENFKSCISLIERAIKERLSLKIVVVEGTTEIVSVKLLEDSLQKSIQKKIIINPLVEEGKSVSVIPSETELNSIYQKIINQSCGSASSNCIPFRYPVDGCFARAHAMRRILLENGYDCQKIFLYGNLAANNGCCVTWRYHVAPLVYVKTSSGTVSRVLDPSLLKAPATIDSWVNVCLNTSCGVSVYETKRQITDGKYMYVSEDASSGFLDDNYSITDCICSTLSGLSGCDDPCPDLSGCF